MTSIRTQTGDENGATSLRNLSAPLSKNAHLLNWVEKMANLTKPDAIHWVDGSPEEDAALKAQMVAGGTFTKLNEELWPGCYYARSHPSDVARVEDRTFICSLSKDAAGPTNNWEELYKMRRKLKELFDGFDARPHDVRAAVQHGTNRLAHVADRRSTHRFSIRRSQHAHHGADRLADSTGRLTGTTNASCPACIRWRAARGGQAGCAVAMQQRKVHCAFPRRARFGLTALAMAATHCWQEMLRSCASLQTLRAMRAGWPSTC